jgi:hypothetical protein
LIISLTFIRYTLIATCSYPTVTGLIHFLQKCIFVNVNTGINVNVKRNMESNIYYIFWLCVCSVSYPACNVHAPYYVLSCGLPGCTIFFNFISYMPWFLKQVTEHKMCVLIFSTNFACNLYHYKKNWARYDKKKLLLVFM